MNLSDAEARMVREALETGLTASRNDDDSIEISLALALLDAKAGECPTCFGDGEVGHPTESKGPHFRGMQCPACHGTGKPIQGEQYQHPEPCSCGAKKLGGEHSDCCLHWAMNTKTWVTEDK